MTQVTYIDNPLKHKNFFEILVILVNDIFSNRELILQLAYRDFIKRYKQSAIGILWVFFMPFVTMGTFLLLNISGVINLGKLPVPYPIYGLLSVSLWNLFSTGLTHTTNSLESSRNLVSRINVSKSAVVISSFLYVIIDFAVRLIILFLIFLIYGKIPPFELVLIPLLIIPIFFLTLTLGFMASLLQVLIKDTIQFVTVFINFAILLLPIMYPLPRIGILATINKYNPIVYILTVPRDIIIGNSPDFKAYFWSCILVIILFIFSWIFFYKSVPKVIEKI